MYSFCRICANTCGVVLELEGDRIVSIHGDREHPVTQGYACAKGRDAGEMHRREDRILRPLKRRADGSFAPIGLRQALDEIAGQVGTLVKRFGPDAIAGFLGTTGYFNVPASAMFTAWMQALGSSSFFSSFTIDCSNKAVTAGRLGVWGAGKQPWSDADVWMIVGANPFVSLSGQCGIPFGNPPKVMRAAAERGTQLIVIDPRRTETARHATVFLQPRPGEDAAVIAGIIRIILSEDLSDGSFCDRYVNGLEQLRVAVDPFTPEHVATRAGVDPEQLRAAALLFGGAGRRGCAGGGTGIGMSPYSNLVDHLIEVLNVVCGRFRRSGETLANGGAPVLPRRPRYAEVIPPTRPWDNARRSRVGDFGMIPSAAGIGEVPTGILADEILEAGDDGIRCLFVEGGNPALAIPDQNKIARALSSLDLLVTVEPFMSATARLAHYIFPPRLMYERPEIPWVFGIDTRLPLPFAQYAPAAVAPPRDSELVDDWEVYWGLARRLGLTITFAGVPMDMESEPTTDDLLALVLHDAQVPFEEIVKHPRGRVYDLPPLVVEPARPGESGRFEVMPEDVRAELELYGRAADDPGFTHRMTVRRMRQYMNSLDPAVPEHARTGRYNPAYLHPSDLLQLNVSPGDRVAIVSDHSRIEAIAAADDRLLPGVVSISHCFGALPGEDDAPDAGASTNRLIDASRHHQTINAMPTMSGLPVTVCRIGAMSEPHPG